MMNWSVSVIVEGQDISYSVIVEHLLCTLGGFGD